MDVIELITSDLNLARSWLKLMKLLQSYVGDIGLGNVAYVDAENGNDLDAKVGSLTHPYATVQAAVTAAAALGAGVTKQVFIGPGTFVEDVVIPAGTTNMIIEGSGIYQTILLSADTGPTLSLTSAAAGLAESGIVVKNMWIQKSTADAVYAVDFDGTLRDDAFLAEPLEFKNVIIVRAGGSDNCLHLTRLNYVYWDRVRIGDPAGLGGVQDATCNEVGRLYASDVEAGNLTLDFDYTGAPPQLYDTSALVHTSVTQSLNVNNQQLVFIGNDAQVALITARTVLIDVAGNPIWGYVDCQGLVGIVDGQHTHEAAEGALATQIVARFDKARISTTFSYADDGADTDTRFIVAANGAVFTSTAADSIVAGNYCDLDLKGATYPNQECLDVSGGGTTGTIDRSDWVQTDAAVAGGAIVFHNGDPTNIPYPAGVTGAGSYYVGLEFDTLADAPGQVAAKTATQYTLTATAANGNVHSHVVRPFSDDIA